jgi:hypothetical protein
MRTFRTTAVGITLSAMSLAALMLLSIPAQAVIVLDPSNNTLSGTITNGTSYSWDSGTCGDCTPTDLTVYEINPNSNPTAADIMEITGDTVSLLYKDNDPGNDESGSFAANYSTVFVPAGDPSSATISYDGGGAIADAKWLEVKDGSADPSIYLFDISGWDGVMDIILRNFWVDPPQGAISHVSIWGGDTPRDMPEPGTLGMLMFGFIGTGAAARLRKKKQAS